MLMLNDLMRYCCEVPALDLEVEDEDEAEWSVVFDSCAGPATGTEAPFVLVDPAPQAASSIASSKIPESEMSGHLRFCINWNISFLLRHCVLVVSSLKLLF